MHHRFVQILLTTGLALCSAKAQLLHADDDISDSRISVTWELITNFTQVKDGFEARFVLKNGGSETLGDTGWGLYFNMAPRPIIDHPDQQPAKIHHINGDWYRMLPEPGFRLPPGESIEIRYAGIEAVIKESDAPLGLYFAFEPAQPEQSRIQRVVDYRILPFTHPQQINRGPNDKQPIPTAAQRYQDNLSLKLLPLDQLPPIVPTPFQWHRTGGSVLVDPKWTIVFEPGLASDANYLAGELSARFGLTLNVRAGGKGEPKASTDIRLSHRPNRVGGIEHEVYVLNISSQGIDLIGSNDAGLFYAIQSLLCLPPFEAYQKTRPAIELPQINLLDVPRFGYRGLHIDVSRNFQTPQTIKRIIDVMAMYKLNRLLLYTTEDEGWRIEIPGLPELTSIGAQRQHNAGSEHPSLHPAYGSGPVAYAPGTHGSGFYSRDELVDLLRYAAQRHVKVIPEVNFPAHARAAIKAMEARYNRLMDEGDPEGADEYRLVDPNDTSTYLSAQSYKDNVVCVARPSTYRFYHKVLDELSQMYADAGLVMDEIHTGGDEVPSGAWTHSPLDKKLIEENPSIGGAENLQAYFFGRLLDQLDRRGLKALAWEEAFLRKNSDGQVEPNPQFVGRNATAYIWNNLFDYDLGNRLANSGYPVVLCNVSNFYFDLAYDKDPQEPGLYWAGFVSEKDAFLFAPFNYQVTTFRTAMGEPIDIEAVQRQYVQLEPAARKNICGVQAQLWSETIKGRDMIEYYMLPKLISFAESAWAAEREWESIPDRTRREREMAKAWNVMANSIGQRELPRLAYFNSGFNYRVPPPGGVVEGSQLKANVALPGLVVRYTTDGTDPTQASPIYTDPVAASGEVRLRAFDASGRASRVVRPLNQ